MYRYFIPYINKIEAINDLKSFTAKLNKHKEKIIKIVLCHVCECVNFEFIYKFA
jgi:hypothetical protein